MRQTRCDQPIWRRGQNVLLLPFSQNWVDLCLRLNCSQLPLARAGLRRPANRPEQQLPQRPAVHPIAAGALHRLVGSRAHRTPDVQHKQVRHRALDLTHLPGHWSAKNHQIIRMMAEQIASLSPTRKGSLRLREVAIRPKKIFRLEQHDCARHLVQFTQKHNLGHRQRENCACPGGLSNRPLVRIAGD